MRRSGVGMNYASVVFLENQVLDGGPMEKLFEEFCSQEILSIFQAKEKILFLSLLCQFKNEPDPQERNAIGKSSFFYYFLQILAETAAVLSLMSLRREICIFYFFIFFFILCSQRPLEELE